MFYNYDFILIKSFSIFKLLFVRGEPIPVWDQSIFISFTTMCYWPEFGVDPFCWGKISMIEFLIKIIYIFIIHNKL